MKRKKLLSALLALSMVISPAYQTGSKTNRSTVPIISRSGTPVFIKESLKDSSSLRSSE